MSAAPALSQNKVKLTILKGSQSGQTFEFTKPVIIIGRGNNNDVKLVSDMKASREHAEIYWKDDSPWIKNISNKNTVIVNGQTITDANLFSGSTITIGETDLRVSYQIQGEVKSTKPVLVPVETVPFSLQDAPSPFPTSRPRSRSYTANSSSNKFNFYIILALILIGAYWLFNGSAAKRKDKLQIRTTEQIQKEMDQSKLALDNIQKTKTKTEGAEYQTAQAYYLKGFRDYRHGQFARAISAFQAALSIYPDHVLAKKYKILAKRRFDEMIQFNMNQGKNYLDNGNYRLCRSAFRNVMIMINDQSDKTYEQAKTFHDQCHAAVEGTY